MDIVIDRDVVQAYYTYYFKRYPYRRKKPIKSPIPPSLNEFTSKVRVQQNAMKQSWNDFILWVLQYKNLKGVNINSCKIHIHYLFPTRIRHDLDNYCIGMKFIGDALVEFGLLKDDSTEYIKKLSFTGEYSKNNPTTIISFNEVGV